MQSPGMRMQSQLGDQDKYVYKMIDGFKLTMSGDSKLVMEKLITLYKRADQISLSPLPNTDLSGLPWPAQITTPRDIWHHFRSEQHKHVESVLVQASEQGSSSSRVSHYWEIERVRS